MWFALIVVVILLTISTCLHFLVFVPLRDDRNRVHVDVESEQVAHELRERLATELGSANKQRTAAMIKVFLDWFNANKTRLGSSDEQLEHLIRSHIKTWPTWRQLQFKWLVDAYRAEDKKRIMRNQERP